jgi:hypothetical protein
VGFFDSLKGIGNALLGTATTAIETFGPAFAQGAAASLFQKAFPGQVGIGQGGFAVGPGGFANPQQFRVPTGLGRPPPPRAPLNVSTPVIPGGQQFSFARPGVGGSQVPGFPVQRAGFDIPGIASDLGFDIPGFDVRSPFVAQGQGSAQLTQHFRSPTMSARPIPLVMVANPITGAPTFYKHAGRPILFSGDMATCKRVDKLARRARRTRPRR